ncbi:MAG: ABC transporter transmembrane domain-containing protein, partial [Myxococcota bacterium]
MVEEHDPSGEKLATLWHRVRPFLRAHRGLYVAAAMLSVLTLSTSVTFPQMIRAVIDQGIQAGNMQSVYFWVVAMAGLLVVQATATYFRFSLLMLGAERVTAAIRTWLFGRLIQHEMGFFDQEGPDNLTARLVQDIQELRLTLSKLAPEIIQAS